MKHAHTKNKAPTPLFSLHHDIAHIGKHMAADPSIVAVEISVKTASGTEVVYRSTDDPRQAKKYQAYLASIGQEDEQ